MRQVDFSGKHALKDIFPSHCLPDAYIYIRVFFPGEGEQHASHADTDHYVVTDEDDAGEFGGVKPSRATHPPSRKRLVPQDGEGVELVLQPHKSGFRGR